MSNQCDFSTKYVELWEVDTLTNHNQPIVQDTCITSPVFKPNGRIHAVCTNTPNHNLVMSLCDVETGHILHSHTLGDMDVNYATLSPDGGTLAVCPAGWKVQLWNTEPWAHRTTLQSYSAGSGQSYSASSGCFSPDGNTLITEGGGPRNILYIWDARTGECCCSLEEENNTGMSGLRGRNHPIFSPDGKTIAIFTGDEDVQLWQLYPAKLDSFTLMQLLAIRTHSQLQADETIEGAPSLEQLNELLPPVLQQRSAFTRLREAIAGFATTYLPFSDSSQTQESDHD